MEYLWYVIKFISQFDIFIQLFFSNYYIFYFLCLWSYLKPINFKPFPSKEKSIMSLICQEEMFLLNRKKKNSSKWSKQSLWKTKLLNKNRSLFKILYFLHNLDLWPSKAIRICWEIKFWRMLLCTLTKQNFGK